MMTAILILAALILATAIGFTLYGLARGCPFAWLTVAFGGLGTMTEALFECVCEILKGFTE